MKITIIYYPAKSWHVTAKKLITGVAGRNATTALRLRGRFRDESSRKLPGCVSVSAMVLALGAQLVSAQATIDVNSGITGSYISDQSYNETRGVDITVLSPVNLSVTSMTLSGIGGTGAATALIYDYNTEQLIASAEGNLTGGTITLAISGVTLVSGEEYQIGFFGDLHNGTLFDPGSTDTFPNPSFPYTESTGLLKIDAAYDVPAVEGFGTEQGSGEPELSLQVFTVPEPASTAMLGTGLVCALGCRRRWALPN